MGAPRTVRGSSSRPLALVATGLLSLSVAGPAAAAPLFLEVFQAPAGASGYPESSRYFTLELADVRAELARAPRESFDAPGPGLLLELPLPGAGSETFEVWESPILHPELAAKFPEIRTYVARGVDDPTASGRLDVTPAGLHAMILSARPTFFIDPVQRGNARDHVTHLKRRRADVGDPRDGWTCDFEEDPAAAAEIQRLIEEREATRHLRGTGQQLRTYRAAVAATGEYTTYHGGTVPAGMAAITTSMNRVTGIYEREVSVRMELIANNDLIVYTNPATDPYTNNNGGAMLSQNQSNLDSVIGNANYDIGHVFSTGGGGIAGLSVVCRAGNKARGVTGLNAPIGDIFDVDYVSHEMGHQYGGNHTFNGNAGSCSGNRSGSSAYEPGSGSTIMAYAGICGSQNIANRSDDYFHSRSFQEITAYTQSGLGSGCPVVTNTGNDPPVPVAGNAGLTIPVSTPFLLTGTGSDPNGDDITYCWEQYDLGPAGHPDTPSGDAPIFRSFDPKTQGARMFPKPSDVRNNVHTIGELLPTYARTLHFRFTVRDNLGGVAWDATSIPVDAGSGPFLVTSVGVTPWNAGEGRTVTWDVAGTDAPPVSCASVNIVLSVTGGTFFDYVLASGVPNDGSADIVVPGLPTEEARIKVEAADNVFFDLNDDNFEITGDATGVLASGPVSGVGLDVRPNPFAGRASVSFSLDRPGHVSIDVFDPAGRRVATLLDGVQGAGSHSLEWNGRAASGGPVAAGVYFVRMETPGDVRMARVVHLK